MTKDCRNTAKHRCNVVMKQQMNGKYGEKSLHCICQKGQGSCLFPGCPQNIRGPDIAASDRPDVDTGENPGKDEPERHGTDEIRYTDGQYLQKYAHNPFNAVFSSMF
jgi:hypothetical protein